MRKLLRSRAAPITKRNPILIRKEIEQVEAIKKTSVFFKKDMQTASRSMKGKNSPNAHFTFFFQPVLHTNQAPQNKLLKNRVASPNPPSCSSF